MLILSLAATSLAPQSASHFISQKVLPWPSLRQSRWQFLKHEEKRSSSASTSRTHIVAATTMHTRNTATNLLAIVLFSSCHWCFAFWNVFDGSRE
ncbi:Uncharacterized protein TCM_004314 [Theobroma cacao]|uniref:Uncharacterized protein n=1 Tax=Theobroma cacao TaxID=3641 RepID=A0A061DQP1_THECC|nr:Uncharacterized protein TCM_004314 [Theobroma cacao]